jgi:hypothetical protein
MINRENRGNAALDVLLLGVVDAALAGCVLVVPLLMGGRHAIGQLVLVSLAVGAAAAWSARECLRPQALWRPTRATALLTAGVVLLLAQLVPLPPSVLGRIAPHTLDVLPLWGPGAEPAIGLGSWSLLSLTPADTRAAMVLFVSYGLLFVVAVQRVERVEDIERLLRWCGLSAAVMASFGLVQYFASNGKFFWFYQSPFTDTLRAAKGSFTNRNHFAQFLALGIGPLIWWLYDTHRRERPARSERFGLAREHQRRELLGYLLVAAVVLVLFAGLLSLSRGGNAVLFLAATLTAVVSCRAAAVRGRFVAGLAAVGLLIGVSLAVFGYDRVSDRFGDLTSGSVEQLDENAARRTIWGAVARAIPDFALLGSGVGSHREVYPMYLDDPGDTSEYTHAESGPLQVALETGGAGAAMVLGGVGLCGWWCVVGMRRARSARLGVCLGAIAAALAANVLHSLVDFVWYVPGCMAVVAILAGCACRGCQLAVEASDAAHRRRRVPRRWAVAGALVVVVVGAGMIRSRVGPAVAQVHWDRYLLSVHVSDAPGAAGEKDASGDASFDAAAVEEEEKRMGVLEQVVRWQPDHARAQLALAQSHLRVFDLLQVTATNPMSLPNIRDAAVQSQSQFPTHQARDEWMRRAFGEHCQHLHRALWHARRALTLCPLQGKGYLYLGELAFLDGAGDSCKKACVEQALRVRPHDAYVLYTAANEAWMAGDPEQWLDYAQRAFRGGPAFQKRVINDLIGHTPPEGIEPVAEFILKELQPDLAGLAFLLAACKDRAEPERLAPLRRHYAQAAESEARTAQGETAASRWLTASGLHVELGDGVRALECARQAQASRPSAYETRRTLALRLVDQGLLAEAETHLRWCLEQRPDDKLLRKSYEQMLANRLDREGGPTR